MTPFREPEAAEAFTRSSVEEYLRAASAEKARLREAIAEARRRTARALLDEQYLAQQDPSAGDPVDDDMADDGLSGHPPYGLPGAGHSGAQLRLTPEGEDIWALSELPRAVVHE
jgi:hypothetical protein